MNIWQWIEKLQQDLAAAGQAHSAQLIDDLSSEVCDQAVERAEALLPEAKALCRTLENPWLDVFIGHWEMRNRIGNKNEGESALADAVALFELAHRADTHECPQSVCITQDLSACYANIDGPGWAAERIEVCDETLARITPKWGCFQCISIEKSEALLDMGQAQQAYDYLQAQSAAIEAAGEEVNAGILEFRNKLLIALGRHEEALEHIASEEAKADGGPEWANIKQPRDILKAQALAALGRDDEALDALPPLREVNPGKLHAWLRAALPLLLRRSELNTWSLASRLQQGLDHLVRHGAHRHALQMAVNLARLAQARGARWSARRQLEQAQALLPKLKTDAGARALLDELATEVAALPATPLPAPAEQLLAWLAQQSEDSPRDPEREVEWLLAALETHPDDIALRGQAVNALQAIGAQDEAIARLWESVKAHTDSDFELAYPLLFALLEQGRHAEVETLAALYQAQVPAFSHWCHAQLARQLGDWQSAAQHCRALLAISPQSQGARRLLAHSLMQQQHFAEAADIQQRLVEELPEDANPRWDYLTAASAAGDWQGVRRMAAEMGMEMPPGDGAPDLDWGWVIIRFIENGEPLDYYARRSGPVDAVVLENAPPKRRQHVGDHVVFDAQPLFPAPENEEERQHFVPTFLAVHTLSPGGRGRSIVLDGVYPDEATFERFRDTLRQQDWPLWVHTSPDYRMQDAHSGEEVPAFVLTIAAPSGTSAGEIDRLLTQATADWPIPPCWLRLAEEAGSDTRRHEDFLERFHS